MRFTGEPPSAVPTAVPTAGLAAVPAAAPSAVSFAYLLTRSMRLSVVGLLVFVFTLVARPMDVSAGPHVHGAPVWKDSYSRRFPGCVALVLWPADEKPAAYVTRNAAGDVSRVRADLGVPAGSTIGACR